MLSTLKSLADRHLFSYFKNPPLLGLDLGLREVRYLALRKSAKHFHIEKIGTFPIAAESLEEQLATWVAGSGLSAYELALALPGQAVVKKRFELSPHFTEAEILNELKFRLCQYCPGEPDQDLPFDFVLGDVKDGKRQVFVVAAKKGELQSQLRVFNKAGLRIKIVDADLYALARAALPFFYTPADPALPLAGLLDLRWPQVSFLVFDQQDLVFHHQWPLDQDQLLPQIKNVWQLFRANHSKLKISYLGLTGELANLGQLTGLLEKELMISVRILNPLLGMRAELEGDEKILEQWGPRFLLCYGLALRGCRYD